MTTETIPLEFVKLKIPRLVPCELVEHVKGRTWTPEQWYEYQEANIDNPNNLLYALIDSAKRIHGYLWAEQSALDGTLFINTFSVDKQHWHKGKAIQLAIEHLRAIKGALKANHVYWVTTNERFFTKHGFKRSKNCLMEYNEEKKD